jgi:hypothetical protein
MTQAESTRYEPPAINFHLGETLPREPQGGGEQTARGPRGVPHPSPAAHSASKTPVNALMLGEQTEKAERGARDFTSG